MREESTCVRSTLQDYRTKTTRYNLFSLSFSMSPHANGTRHLIYQCDRCLVPLEKWSRGGMGVKNDPKAKQREWPPGKRCTKYIEVMKQGQLHLSQTTDCWLCPRSSFLTVLNKFNFIIIITVVLQEINGLSLSWPESSISTTWKNVEKMCT